MLKIKNRYGFRHNGFSFYRLYFQLLELLLGKAHE